MIISLDTETTGIDIAHGAMPFLVTWYEKGSAGPCLCQWPVDVMTRRPEIPEEDIAHIAEVIDASDLVYLQNSKFDVRALASIGIEVPWSKVRDTLAMGHLLASNHRHDLTSMCIEYLGVNIDKYEVEVKRVTQECRGIVKRDYPSWLIADEGVQGMPSVKGSSKRDEDKPWKNDMWLPAALANYYVTNGLCDESEIDERWLTACPRYAYADSEHALHLGLEMERLIRSRGLWSIYEHRLHLPRVACEMECWGLTAIGDYTEGAVNSYEEHVAEAEDVLTSIAAKYGHKLELADGASLNDNMRDFFYGSVINACPRCTYTKRVKHWNGEGQAAWIDKPTCPKCAKPSGRGKNKRPGMTHELVTVRRANLNLPIIASVKSGNASLDAAALQEYVNTTEGDAQEFIRVLLDKRGYDTALSYMAGYQRFWLPVPGHPGYYRIHGSLNPFGTDHLRWASNSPNMQNIGVGDDEGELSLRECFGPLPDREWWRMDFKNIEKRIPAYECMEPKLVEIFEKPDEPPYWGSDHNLIASLLWPDEFWPLADKNGFKSAYPRLYKRGKNTNFAKQYGAGKKKVEATAGVSGAYDLIDRGLPELAKLQAKYLRDAERVGWVQTLPDRTVDPDRGYPILASRTEDGRVLSTTPFNYHVSGTACWAKNTALIRCSDQCAVWRAEGFDAHVALEIHDEILFDFPRGATMEDNLPRALVLKGLMEQAGENLIPRIPSPVSVEYHTRSWAEGVPV